MNAPELKKSKVDFLLVSVRGDGEELTKRIRAFLAIAKEHGAAAKLIGGDILATYGAAGDEEKGDHEPGRLLAALKNHLSSDIKILYGAEVGHSGLFIGRESIGYNILLPHLTRARHRLHELNWGEVFEFAPKESDASPG